MARLFLRARLPDVPKDTPVGIPFSCNLFFYRCLGFVQDPGGVSVPFVQHRLSPEIDCSFLDFIEGSSASNRYLVTAPSLASPSLMPAGSPRFSSASPSRIIPTKFMFRAPLNESFHPFPLPNPVAVVPFSPSTCYCFFEAVPAFLHPMKFKAFRPGSERTRRKKTPPLTPVPNLSLIRLHRRPFKTFPFPPPNSGVHAFPRLFFFTKL